MPRRRDLRSICLIGSGPIVIGQACEFDYAGSQALKVLREDGFRTIVVNSNPATIMTDPGFADRTYLEPLDLDGVADVLGRERPDALLPTLGGQTALNLALALDDRGVLESLGIELIGAGPEVIRRAEDRELFRETVRAAGLRVPESTIVTRPEDAPVDLTFPVILRPAFTLGGRGCRARRRRRVRRLQHPVRARARNRRGARDRDEPARLALLGARIEGDRLPDRQGRSEARSRLHARRDPERPDRHDARELRT